MNDIRQADALDRFKSKYDQGNPEECWTWKGAFDNGYGRFWLNRKSTLAHRVSYELANGPITPGLHIDHLCRNRACVNPAHMEPVDIATNVLRGTGITATNLAKTQCHRDHPLDEKNTYLKPDGNRGCKECQRQRVRDWRARQGGAK